MSSRSRRGTRRQRGEARPIIGRTELVATAVVVAAAGITIGLLLLLTGGDDDGGTAPEVTPSATVTGTPFEPADDDGQAILALGRRSVESLPEGVWPELYDSFTREFRDRCPFTDFTAAGEADASNLGDSLELHRFKYLIDVVVSGDTASAVIVGTVGDSEFTIETAYAREDGEWKIAPAPDTAGCNAFNRLSG